MRLFILLPPYYGYFDTISKFLFMMFFKDDAKYSELRVNW